MSNSRQPGFTTVAKKFVIALSGLGLVVFVILHLLGNLSLYQTEGTAFNAYAFQLHSFGSLVILGELGLLAVFVLHFVPAIWERLNNKKARPQSYRVWKSKGGQTPSNRSSRNMILTGAFLLIFLIIHVWQFRFGPSIDQGYVTTIKSEQARDLFRLVVETFKNPIMVVFYTTAMLVLATHLKHGIWSATQSLGLTRPETTGRMRVAGTVLAILLSVGFLFIPVWIYFGIRT